MIASQTAVGSGGGGGGGNVTIVSPIGQQVSAASVGVVIASDQSPVPVTATVSPPTSSSANSPAQTTVSTSASQIVTSSTKGVRIKNTGTTVIKLGLGANPTQSAYHIPLAAGGSANDGTGGEWDGTISGTLWTGAVYAISSASGGTCVITQLS